MYFRLQYSVWYYICVNIRTWHWMDDSASYGTASGPPTSKSL